MLGQAVGCDLGEIQGVFVEEHNHVWRHQTQLHHESGQRSEDPSVPAGALEPRHRQGAADAVHVSEEHRRRGRLLGAGPSQLGALSPEEEEERARFGLSQQCSSSVIVLGRASSLTLIARIVAGRLRNWEVRCFVFRPETLKCVTSGKS